MIPAVWLRSQGPTRGAWGWRGLRQHLRGQNIRTPFFGHPIPLSPQFPACIASILFAAPASSPAGDKEKGRCFPTRAISGGAPCCPVSWLLTADKLDRVCLLIRRGKPRHWLPEAGSVHSAATPQGRQGSFSAITTPTSTSLHAQASHPCPVTHRASSHRKMRPRARCFSPRLCDLVSVRGRERGASPSEGGEGWLLPRKTNPVTF